MRTIDTPMQLSETPGGADLAPPLLGQHTMEILTGLAGLTRDDVARLAAEGAVKCG